LALYYSETLTRERVVGISEKYGFPANQLVEKFVMCLEMHKRITQKIRCHTRGGMCMPFHQPGFEVRRMSKDIDMPTGHSVDEVERVMNSMDGVDGLRCSKIDPRNPLPIENLVSYRIAYDSCLGRQERVKVDAFCGADMNLDTRLIPPGSRILDFETLQEMTILSRGALIADKITSLAVGTVGVNGESHTEIVKQIYDIALLLRQASAEDLETSHDSYRRLTEFKVGCFRHDPPYTISDVTASVVQLLCDLLPLKTKEIVAPNLLRRYRGFQGSYLTKRHSYTASNHITDVILVLVLVMSIQRRSEGHPPPSEAGEAGHLHRILENLGQLGQLDANSARLRRTEYLDGIPGRMINRKMIKDSPLEHLYLIRELAPFWPIPASDSPAN
jgi:hypothetical protein